MDAQAVTRFRTAILAAALSAALAQPAAAQTSPNFTYGFVPTVAQWNSYFAAKQDVLAAPPLLTTGGQMTGPLITAASATGNAGFNLPPGVAPASPHNGDLWTTGSSIFAQVGGVTYDLIGSPCLNCALTTAANTFTASPQTVQGLTTTSPGWYAQITGDTFARVRVGMNSTDVASVAFGPGNVARDAFIERVGAGSLRFGGPDAAAPVAQTSSVQNVVAGTSNAAGANRIIAGSQGTGTGIGGDIIFQTAPAGSSGTAQNALVTALTVSHLGYPIALTASPGTNTTQLATTAFVQAGLLNNNLHLVVFTVAPSGASAADKARADYVGDGTNDQTAVNSAVNAAKAISGYSKVVMLPGVYNFSGTADVSGGNGFVFEARGTQVNGPGVGGAATATDTFKIQNSNFAEFNFGAIKTNNTGTAAAIHSTGGYSETKVTWQSLDGTSRSGYGYFSDTTSAGTAQSVNWITATHVQNFAKGLAFISVGSGAAQDTFRITVDYIYNNVIGIYEHSGAGVAVQTNTFVYNVNLDCHHTNGDIGLQTNGLYDVINAVIGPIVTLDSGTCTNIQIDSGAANTVLNVTPEPLAATAGSIVDNSVGPTSLYNVGMIPSLLTSVPSGQLVKWTANPGQLGNTGITLGTIGTINTLTYFSAAGVLSSLATAANSLLVTDGSGVPSLSTTLPSNVRVTLSTSPTTSGGLGFNSGTLNFGDGVTNHVLVSTDQTLTLTNKTIAFASNTLTGVAPLASPTFTGVVTMPTPFTLGAVSVTSTGTQLNYLSAATGTTGTTSTNVVFSTSPTLVTPTLGVASATSINKVTITAPATGSTLTIADGKTATHNASTTFAGTDGKTLTISNSGTFAGGDAFTLAIAASKTLTVSNSMTLTATDGSTLAIGAGGTLGTAAYVNTGTSGGTVPLLNADNTYSGQAIFTSSKVLAVTGSAGGGGFQPSAFNIWGGANPTLSGSGVDNSSYPSSGVTIAINHANGSGQINGITVGAAGGGSAGVTIGAPTGGDKGTGTINVQSDATINGQEFMPNITTSSAAQTGTVCWTTGTGKLTVDTTVGCLTSIMAAKNITEHLSPTKALDIVSRLDPFAFRYKPGYGDSGHYEQFGFGAEEVALVDERLAGRDPQGTLSGVRYQEMTAVLAGAIQQLKADNDNLKSEVETLRRARR